MQCSISDEDEDGSQDEGQKKLHVDKNYEYSAASWRRDGGWDERN